MGIYLIVSDEVGRAESPGGMDCWFCVTVSNGSQNLSLIIFCNIFLFMDKNQSSSETSVGGLSCVETEHIWHFCHLSQNVNNPDDIKSQHRGLEVKCSLSKVTLFHCYGCNKISQTFPVPYFSFRHLLSCCNVSSYHVNLSMIFTCIVLYILLIIKGRSNRNLHRNPPRPHEL